MIRIPELSNAEVFIPFFTRGRKLIPPKEFLERKSVWMTRCGLRKFRKAESSKKKIH